MATFCNNCIEGICVPQTVKVRGLDGEQSSIQKDGCVAFSLFKTGFIDNPKVHCGCYAKDPAKHNYVKPIKEGTLG